MCVETLVLMRSTKSEAEDDVCSIMDSSRFLVKKSPFGYQNGYGGRLIGVSICGDTSETGTQLTIFD
jgi:hypothetical protein